VDALRRLAAAAEANAQHPALLRLRELETLGALGSNASARLYIGFDNTATASALSEPRRPGRPSPGAPDGCEAGTRIVRWPSQ